MTIGEKITKIRKEQNLTQEQFAQLMDVSRQSVSKWELNTAYPDTEKLIKMCKLFNCSLDYLLKEEIENTDANINTESERAIQQKLQACILTYLSFPPLFGWIVAIFSLKLQLSAIRNKKQTILTIIGMIISLALTIIMIVGAIYQI